MILPLIEAGKFITESVHIFLIILDWSCLIFKWLIIDIYIYIHIYIYIYIYIYSAVQATLPFIEVAKFITEPAAIFLITLD